MFWGVSSTSQVLEEIDLSPRAAGALTVPALPRGTKLFALEVSLSLKLRVSFHFMHTFPVVSNHPLLKSFVQRKRESLPTSEYM